MLNKLFKKTQEDDAMSPLEKLNREIAEAQDKITQAEANVAAAEQAYNAALIADDEAAAMAQLEALDAAKRAARLHNDRLPVLEARIPEATKISAEPEIRARCIELQAKCDEEKELILKYHATVQELRAVNNELSMLMQDVGNELRTLQDDIRKAGNPYHPAVERLTFHQQSDALHTLARWHFNGAGERGFTAHEYKTPEQREQWFRDLERKQKENTAARKKAEAEAAEREAREARGDHVMRVIA